MNSPDTTMLQDARERVTQLPVLVSCKIRYSTDDEVSPGPAANDGPGFWTGAALGALGGYFAGNRQVTKRSIDEFSLAKSIQS